MVFSRPRSISTNPNSNFDFKNSPFRVVSKRSNWEVNDGPRRAGVSAFGVGGTNAHVVLEQAPDREPSTSRRSRHLLVLSARSPAALEQATDNLAAHLSSHADLNLADAAWTLQVGRRAFDHRRAVVAGRCGRGCRLLSKRDRDQMQTRLKPKDCAGGLFSLSGAGIAASEYGARDL